LRSGALGPRMLSESVESAAMSCSCRRLRRELLQMRCTRFESPCHSDPLRSSAWRRAAAPDPAAAVGRIRVPPCGVGVAHDRSNEVGRRAVLSQQIIGRARLDADLVAGECEVVPHVLPFHAQLRFGPPGSCQSVPVGDVACCMKARAVPVRALAATGPGCCNAAVDSAYLAADKGLVSNASLQDFLVTRSSLRSSVAADRGDVVAVPSDCVLRRCADELPGRWH